MTKRRLSTPVPNEQLKQARLLHGWSQEDVAGHIGTDGNTVNRWERGRARPGPYFRQQLCNLFGKSVLELGLVPTSQERPVSIVPISADSKPVFYWHVPYRRNPFFTGREYLFYHLHEQLGSGKEVAITPSSALHGLGGIGKTQTALEYAYRYARYYTAIFWIEAETAEGISASFLRIAEQLELPERREADQSQIVAAVQRWLANQHGWLLIWDNVEDLELLQHWLPSTREGSLLFTTRRQALGTLAQGIELPTMTPEEGLLFLLRRAKVLPLETSSEQMHQLFQEIPGTVTAAQELVTVLGGLPLALDQAGAYVEETPCRLEDYLELYQMRRAELLTRRGDAVLDHPASVATTWSLSFERMERANPAAADLLRLCAFLYPDAIPEELFREGGALLGARLRPVAADAFRLHEAFRAITAYSLLKRNVEERTLSIHRLVQAVLWEGMSEQEREVWQWRAIRLLHAAFPEITHHAWEQCERLLSHVLTCAATIPDDTYDLDLAEVLRKAADYLRGRARFDQPEPFYQRALRIEEQVGGPEHLRMAAPLFGLALLYYEQGKYEQAEPLCQRALSIWEHALEAEDPELARPLNGLAIIYLIQGKYVQTEPLFQRALQIREQALGREHPLLVGPLTNLADLYTEQGKDEQAEPLFKRAIRIQERALGAERPQIAYPLHGLARLYSRQGKDELAEPLFQRALQVRERELGAEHPYVAEPLTGLAIISSRQGKDEQAERLYQRAVYLCEHAFGPKHPDVATPLTNLADLYTKQGKYEQAEALYRRALHIREQALGLEHPLVATALNGLATLYLRQERNEEAEALYQRALSIREQRLGWHHPDTVQTLNGLANLFVQQEK